MKKVLITSIIALLGVVNVGLTQDLVYRPVNPAFGGDPFNYQWLMSSAQAQNDFTEESSSLSAFNQNPLDDFESSLNRQILSQLSRELVNDIFGEEGLQDGTFEIGSFQIEILSGLDGVTVNIFDSANGGSTSIIVPYY